VGVSRVMRRWRRAALAVVFLMAFGTMVAPPVAAATDLCGSSISSDLELDADLSCPTDGLVIAANGITIKLNGHVIMGPGSGSESVGLRIAGRSDVSVLGPGTITGFRTGVLVESSEDIVVKRISAVENGLPVIPPVAFPVSRHDGIHVTMSSNVDLEKNLVKGNADDGINVHMSTGVRVVKNEVNDNGHDGIRLDLADGNIIARNLVVSHDQIFSGTPVGCGIELFGSKDNEIEENRLVANTNGIRLRINGTSLASTGNEVEENMVDGTGADLGGRRGIHVRDVSTGNEIEGNTVANYLAGIRVGDPGAPVGNTFEENKIRMNTCGIQGSTVGNEFEDNKLKDNGADFCP